MVESHSCFATRRDYKEEKEPLPQSQDLVVRRIGFAAWPAEKEAVAAMTELGCHLRSHRGYIEPAEVLE